jgi:hypothetical protein
MSIKIFKSILTVTLCAIIAAACAFFAVYYNSFLSQTRSEMKQTAILAGNAIEQYGIGYFENAGGTELKFTLISESGNIIFEISIPRNTTAKFLYKDKEITLSQGTNRFETAL